MSVKSRPTYRQLVEEAERYAGHYFDPAEIARRVEEAGQCADAAFVVLAQNRFVPLDSISGSAAMLRRFVQGRLDLRDADEWQLLKEYWACLDGARERVSRLLAVEGPGQAVTELARSHGAWPAVGLANSEGEFRSLLLLQFERICQARVPWQGVDSSTNYLPMRSGVCVLVDWFWHGM
jgi:hypothetical protein